MVDRISTLKDLRDYLNQISDEDLARLGIGINYDSDCEVAIVTTDDTLEVFDRVPKLTLLHRWLQNIKFYHERYNDQETDDVEVDDYISSDKVKEAEHMYWKEDVLTESNEVKS